MSRYYQYLLFNWHHLNKPDNKQFVVFTVSWLIRRPYSKQTRKDCAPIHSLSQWSIKFLLLFFDATQFEFTCSLRAPKEPRILTIVDNTLFTFMTTQCLPAAYRVVAVCCFFLDVLLHKLLGKYRRGSTTDNPSSSRLIHCLVYWTSSTTTDNYRGSKLGSAQSLNSRPTLGHKTGSSDRW